MLERTQSTGEALASKSLDHVIGGRGRQQRSKTDASRLYQSYSPFLRSIQSARAALLDRPRLDLVLEGTAYIRNLFWWRKDCLPCSLNVSLRSHSSSAMSLYCRFH